MAGKYQKSLASLLKDFPLEIPQALQNVGVTGIVLDSREVQPGNIFVALAGENVDGHRFIPQAVKSGAVAVIGSQPDLGFGVPYLQTQEPRREPAKIAAAFFDHPGRKLRVIGVTGTDGKTTTANLVYQILRSAGLSAGIISTVNATIGDEVLDTGLHVTTPESPNVQAYLAQMVEAGLTHVVIEATSHGLAQQRVAGCEFDVAVVTNITHEHLDYHGSYDAYLGAKACLFTSLAETFPKGLGNIRLAVFNQDDYSYSFLNPIQGINQISYSLHPGASYYASNICEGPDGISFKVNGLGKVFSINSSLVGLFNVSNCLAAIGVTVAGLGLPFEVIQAGIAAMTGVPGRMERIDLGQNFTAIVDFAHTPNALRQALQTVREMVRQPSRGLSTPSLKGRVIAVFGSAGLRDRQKRRMMAETSVELADITILTAEDPRTESLEGILAEMAAGAAAKGGIEGKTFYRIPDRGDALRFAIQLAQPGDLVIACGKGHEQSMCFGEKEYPWDDRTAMRAALAKHLGVAGPEMPGLPAEKS
jgi:UDP-N-acetylmuramoyl-L-alanyl-D-glutamate--2,6-diaminopimelate ligase